MKKNALKMFDLVDDSSLSSKIKKKDTFGLIAKNKEQN